MNDVQLLSHFPQLGDTVMVFQTDHHHNSIVFDCNLQQNTAHEMSSADELARPKADQCFEIINLLLVAEAREDGEMSGMLAVGEALSAKMARDNVAAHASRCPKCRRNGWY